MTQPEETLLLLRKLDLAVNGEGTLDGDPGLVGAVRELRTDIVAIKSRRESALAHVWTGLIAVVTGYMGAGLKTGGH